MSERRKTIFQNLNHMLLGSSVPGEMVKLPPTMGEIAKNQVLYSTTDKAEYEKKLASYKQQKLLSYQWYKAGVDNSIESLAGYTAVKLMYRDADLMDGMNGMPEIGAALDILSEEACLDGNTKIKLLNGTVKTISELYENNETNFWCYSVNEKGIIKPTQVEKIVYKGEKPTIKIILDDNSEIICTKDHKWMLSDTTWIETSELKKGDALMSIYDSLNYKGYEQVKSTVEPKKRLTHQIVANEILHEEKMKLAENNHPFQKIVIHHKSFDKLNNDPSYLTFMYWNDHQKLHTDLNRERWDDEEFAKRMKQIFSQTAKKTWEENRETMLEKFSKSRKEYFSKLSQEEKNKIYGRKGEINGMYGVHRYGNTNPNYDASKNHIEDINEKDYMDYVISYTGVDINQSISKNFNLSISSVIDYNKILCEKYGIPKISYFKFNNNEIISKIKNYVKSHTNTTYDDLSREFGFSVNCIKTIFRHNNIKFNELRYENKWRGINKNEYINFLRTLNFNKEIYSKLISHFNIPLKRLKILNNQLLKEYHLKTIKSLKYILKPELSITNIKDLLLKGKNEQEICKLLKISTHELLNICKYNGYKNYKDLTNSLYNHRIKDIIFNYGYEKVYDLKNSSVNNCFGVKCNKGLIISHNCNFTSEGEMVKVSSKSKRIKSILEDLYVNRLNIHIMLPMIARAMLKYGNQFMLLNVTKDNGIIGWKQLPVYEIDRIENGYTNSATMSSLPIQTNEIKPDETRFVWVGHNESMPYKNWQIAHFRLLNDSFLLPYGVSHLFKARRAWRMWSMMEDSMLTYRLEHSVERRVFKIYVGSIDDDDVPAFVQDIANNFKRTPIIDPLTGQIDLRKNYLDVSADYFIPVRDPNAPTPIENLQSTENKTSIEDIQYMQNKVFAALRTPKTFLNFQEAQGKGQNLSLLDIRTARMVNRIQQFLLMELTKVGIIHLCLMGLKDDAMNFTLSMNNPSAQIEALELEDTTKRIQTATAALTDPGIGIPLMSLHRVLKKIMKMSDDEIKDMLLEIRLEKAMAAELEQTSAIIKKTGIFDSVDRIYGDYDVMNSDNPTGQQQQGEGEGDDMGAGAMGGGGDGFDGGALAFDSLGSEGGGDMGDIGGDEGTTDMENAPEVDNGGPMESSKKNKPLIIEDKKKKYKSFTERYLDKLAESKKMEEGIEEMENFEGKNDFLNEKINNMLNKVDNILDESMNYSLDETESITDEEIDDELNKDL